MASHLGSFREYGAGTWPAFWLVVGLADFHVIWEDAFFSYSLTLLSALSLINFSGLFSHQEKFYSFMFIHKISTQVAYVNVSTPIFYKTISELPEASVSKRG